MFSVGTDIIELDRFKKGFNKKFLEKVYSKGELDIYTNDTLKLASNFAAKEAVAKVLGTGFKFFPRDIEIYRESSGKPYVVLQGKALEIANKQNIEEFHLTISHSKDYVVAFCLGVEKHESKS